MPALPPDRVFLFSAAIGVLLALASSLILRGAAAGSDAGAPLLAGLVLGVALTMGSLVPPATRMLVTGWRRVGIGPRDAMGSARLADGLSVAVWALWLLGAAAVLPNAWGPMLGYLADG